MSVDVPEFDGAKLWWRYPFPPEDRRGDEPLVSVPAKQHAPQHRPMLD